MLPEVRDGMRDWKLGRVVTVAGRGFSSNANPDYLRRGGGQPVAGERMRDKAGDAAEALSRQGRFTVAGDHLHMKEGHRVQCELDPPARDQQHWEERPGAGPGDPHRHVADTGRQPQQ